MRAELLIVMKKGLDCRLWLDFSLLKYFDVLNTRFVCRSYWWSRGLSSRKRCDGFKGVDVWLWFASDWVERFRLSTSLEGLYWWRIWIVRFCDDLLLN